MKNKKTIAIFIYDVSLVGGAEMISLKLANDFYHSYNVIIISLFCKNGKPIIDIGSIEYIVLSDKIGSIPKNLFRYSNSLRNILKKHKIDILLGITAGINSICLLGSLGLDTKWVYCEHSNLENQTYGRLHFLRQLIGAYFSSKVVVLTDRDARNFIKVFRLNMNKVLSIPNYFEKDKTNKNYQLSSKLIISAGRLVSIKQFDHILDISSDIFSKHPDWQWHIYGSGELEYNLQSKICKLNLAYNVKLKGVISNLIDVMNNYSFLVMTSKYEGLPLTLLEAQSQKLPVVAYDCPTGPSEIISNNINGFLISNQNKDEMKIKILELIDNFDLRKAFSDNSFLNLQQYSKFRVLDKWDNLFKNI